MNDNVKIAWVFAIAAILIVATVALAITFHDVLYIKAGLCPQPFKYVLNGTEYSKDVWTPCKPLTAESGR